MSRASGCHYVLLAVMAGCCIGNASTVDFSGNFLFDDDVQFFTFQSPNPGTVTITTTSFAQGGFAPILALYDATGVLLTYDDGTADGFCAGTDIRGTGYCYDASLSWEAAANAIYYTALSQYDNFPIDNIPVTLTVTNWNNSTDFFKTGDHFFTAHGPFGPGCGLSPQHFCLVDGNLRGPNWALSASGPEGFFGSARQVPETGTLFLILGGLAMICGRLLRLRGRRT